MKKLLEDQRKKSKIDPEELACLLYRGKDRFERVKQGWKLALEAAGPNSPLIYEMSRDQIFHYLHEKVSKLRNKIYPGLVEQDEACAEFFTLHNFQYPGSVGQYMVVQVLRTLGTDVQKQKWVAPILNNVFFACYAQTELSVGNDTQNLQTLAVFDEKTQEFVIHTPSVEAIKWWPGDLGLTATHALVVARLVTRGKDHGVQSFFVEIRHPETHIPHAGIEIGDIGPKLGYNSKDHGFLRFTKYRVPKESLLARYLSLEPDGEVRSQGNPKRMYAGMMIMRSAIMVNSYSTVLKAATIATRYSLYRTQFKDSTGKLVTIYDYQMQRDKLMREISRGYIMALTARSVFAQLDLNNKLTENDDFTELQNTHIILCVCKANFSYWATAAHSNLIRACGGHGFSHYSGLPHILVEEYPNQIVEGENSVLLLQVARQLYKSFSDMKKENLEKLTGPFKFLGQFDKWMEAKVSVDEHNRISLDDLLVVLYRSTCFALEKSSLKMFRLVQEHKDSMKVWNEFMGNDNQRLAKIFSVQYVIESSIGHCKSITNQPIRSAITSLVELGAIHFIEELSSFVLESGSLEPNQLSVLLERSCSLLDELKDDGLLLAEGLQWRDEHLATAIGNSDKDPYETLYLWAKQYGSLNKYDNQIHPALAKFQIPLSRERGQKL